MAPDRLKRHLGTELGRVGDAEEVVPLADRPVLRQRPAGLPHEPHRRPLDGLAAERTHEKGLAHHRSVALDG